MSLGVESGADVHIPGANAIADGIETLFHEMLWIANTSGMNVAVDRELLRMVISTYSPRHGLFPQTVSAGQPVGRYPQCLQYCATSEQSNEGISRGLHM